MANANWSNPQLTSTYTNFVSEVKNRDEDLALQFDGTTSTNIPTNTIRWDSTANRWKKWSGTAWGELTSTYALTGLSTTGNASVGGTLGVTGAITGSSTITGTVLIPSGSTAPTNGIYLPSANNVAIATAGGGRLFVDSSGNVGVGVSSPQHPVHIDGTSGAVQFRAGVTYAGTGLDIKATENSDVTIDVNDSTKTVARALVFSQAGSERMRIDSSGNVGIGVTPSASWSSTSKPLQLGASSAIEGRTNDGSHVALYANAIWNGTNLVYQNTAAATYYKQSSAVHSWYTASAGTAGNTIGFTQAMTLDASGRLLIGAIASPAYQLQVSTDSAGKPSTNTWTIVSDERIKEDIELADLDICYEAIKAIPLKRYKWRDDVYTAEQVADRRKLGWIAQDVEAVFPKAVSVHEFKYNQVFAETVIPAVEEVLGSDGEVITPAEPERIERELVSEDVIEDCKDLNADQVYAAMYGALQKLISKVETLEAEVAALKAA